MAERSVGEILGDFERDYRLREQIRSRPEWGFWKTYVDNNLSQYFCHLAPDKLNALLDLFRQMITHYYMEFYVQQCIETFPQQPGMDIFRGIQNRLRDLQPTPWPGMLEHTKYLLQQKLGQFEEEKEVERRWVNTVDASRFESDDETLATICIEESYISKFWVSLEDRGKRLYTFNEKSATWCGEDRGYTIYTLRHEVATILQRMLLPIVENLVASLKKVHPDSDEAEQIKSQLRFYKDIRTSVGNLGKSLAIATVIGCKLFQEETERVRTTGVGFLDLTVSKTLDYFPIADNIKVNLRTKERTPRVKEDYFTWTTTIPNTPKASQDTARQFIKDIMWDTPEHPRPNLTKFEIVFLGYCITGRVNRKIGVWDIGELANNGKTTKMTLLKDLLGPTVCGEVPKEVVIETNGKVSAGAAMSHLVLMRSPKRFVWTSEIKRGDKVNEPQYKAITGMDTLSARDLWEKYKDAALHNTQNTCKVILMANDAPDYTFDDKGMINRVVILPHDRVMTSNPLHPNEMKAADLDQLRDEFKMPENRAGFFNLLVDGAADSYKIEDDAMSIPEECKTATLNHRINSDSVRAYYDAACSSQGAVYNDHCAGGKLYVNYQAWCRETGLKDVGGKTFGERFLKYHIAATGLDDKQARTKTSGVSTYRHLKVFFIPNVEYI
jgi:phage/plasmid-associated DNA primase